MVGLVVFCVRLTVGVKGGEKGGGSAGVVGDVNEVEGDRTKGDGGDKSGVLESGGFCAIPLVVIVVVVLVFVFAAGMLVTYFGMVDELDFGKDEAAIEDARLRERGDEESMGEGGFEDEDEEDLRRPAGGFDCPGVGICRMGVEFSVGGEKAIVKFRTRACEGMAIGCGAGAAFGRNAVSMLLLRILVVRLTGAGLVGGLVSACRVCLIISTEGVGVGSLWGKPSIGEETSTDW
jgi:hypothetical protein